ncbi:MAG: hypothetical protein KAH48_03805, partial [Chlorobi bacterium]|nr:hypothetical protein [Chlorobiota bacterium]
MKKSILFLIICISLILPTSHAYSQVTNDDTNVELARMFSKDIFDLNGVPYMKPMIESINATSNSRFFNQAYVPRSVKKPYFRVGIHAMAGVVSDASKVYNPAMPMAQMEYQELLKYADIDLINGTVTILDTAGLMYYAIKSVIYDGVHKGAVVDGERRYIEVPDEAATVLGNKKQAFILENDLMKALIESNPIYALLPDATKKLIVDNIALFPEYFTLPQGANMNTMLAAIPQFEIGSLYGTELLLRFIPPVDMGEEIGDFAFWGIGLKHSLSQYFFNDPGVDAEYYERPFDLAFQVVYQGTSLENFIGVTNAKLVANATFWDFNIQASKNFFEWLDVYSGLSLELFDVVADYTYKIPVETQLQLGLMRLDSATNEIIADPENGYPGDNKPQTTSM